MFINICTSSSVPAPKTISEQELLEILDKYDDESDETVSYRVPMSIGEGHTELDNKSKACTAYDVIVSTSVSNVQMIINKFLYECYILKIF